MVLNVRKKQIGELPLSSGPDVPQLARSESQEIWQRGLESRALRVALHAAFPPWLTLLLVRSKVSLQHSLLNARISPEPFQLAHFDPDQSQKKAGSSCTTQQLSATEVMRTF